CKQGKQCGRPMMCGLIGSSRSEQCHCPADITPLTNEGSVASTLPPSLRRSRTFVSRSKLPPGLWAIRHITAPT
ncbi:hypothetical protein, partial [Xanthomonas hortorum]